MIQVNFHDPLYDDAVKDSEEKKKQYDDAMEANKEGVSTIDKLNKREENQKQPIKSSDMNKMHLSESLFEDMGFSLDDLHDSTEDFNDEVFQALEEIVDRWEPAVTVWNIRDAVDKFIKEYMDDGEYEDIDESFKSTIDEDISEFDSFLDDITKDVVGNIHESFDASSVDEEELIGLLYDWGTNYDPYDLEEDSPEDLAREMQTPEDYKQAYNFIKEAMEEGFTDDEEFISFTNGLLHKLEEYLSAHGIHVDKPIVTEGLKKKINESVDMQFAKDVANKIVEECPKDVEVYTCHGGDDGKSYATVVFKIENGDWKHDHLAFRYWMDQNAEEITDCTVKFGGETPLTDNNDVYSATHEYYFIPKEEEQPEDEPLDEPSDDEEDYSDVPDENETDASLQPSEDENIDMNESLKFNIAKEQIKRFKEGKMLPGWDANIYLENLVKKHHISQTESDTIREAFLAN